MIITPSAPFVDSHQLNSFDKAGSSNNAFSDQIIYCAHARLNYMSPPLYSRRQIFCGPRDETDYVPGSQTGFVKTAFGEYLLSNYINEHKLPEPKVLVVHVDEFGTNLPQDINDFDCKKVMILGDTHQSTQGINKVLNFFQNSRFDYYFADCKKNHLHFFYETAPDRSFIFFPCFRNRFEATVFNNNKQHYVSLIGQLKATHPYRLNIAEILRESGLPALISEASQEQSAGVYNNFLINVNVSLNNELNMRFLEVISAGGFLLTDRISTFTGYDDIFKENEDFIFYDNPKDLIEKIRYYLKHPQKAIKIARSGWLKYMSNWSIANRRQKFWGLLNDSATASFPNFMDERFPSMVKASTDNFEFRKLFYGLLQELNKEGYFKVYIPRFIHPIISRDVEDLCRLVFICYDSIENLPTISPGESFQDLPNILVGQEHFFQSLANENQVLKAFKNLIRI